VQRNLKVVAKAYPIPDQLTERLWIAIEV